MSAEANRLMGNYKISEDHLEVVAKNLIEKCRNNSTPSEELSTEWVDRVKQVKKVCRQKWVNIQGRLLDTYVALCLDRLEDLEKLKNKSRLNKSLAQIINILPIYFQAIKWQSPNRKGYLESVAAYLSWIAERKAIDGYSTNSESIAKAMYRKNRKYLLPYEKQNGKNSNDQNQHDCPICTKLEIDLEKPDATHYQQFVKNMRDFFGRFKDFKNDAIHFHDYIFNIERKHKEDSAYQKRKMSMNQIEVVPNNNWCSECLDKKNKSSFTGLLSCASPPKKNDDRLCQEHYEHIMDNWDNRFRNHLEIESVHLPHCSALHLLGLQRWNSTSPAIGRSLGGGYLIYHTDVNGKVDLGVAIDPGFDFVRNLFHLGFSLSDIDVVLLSHAHLDHIRDFESLVTLCLELKKRHPDKVKRRLHSIMTLGVYQRLSHIFASPGLREFVEPYILDIEKEIQPDFVKPYIDKLEYYNDYFSGLNGNNSLTISNLERQGFSFHKAPKPQAEQTTDRGLRFLIEIPPKNSKNNNDLGLTVAATRAYHNDFSEYSDSFGFKITISSNGGESTTIGYTGDTSWSHDIIDQYKDCNALLVHIGSLIDREDEEPHFNKYEQEKKEWRKERGKECWELVKKKNHPYLFGLFRFLTEISNFPEFNIIPLVFLGEFGEELRGRIRLDLYKRLKETYSNEENQKKNIPLLPLDVGLDVILHVDKLMNNSKLSLKNKKEWARLRKLFKNNNQSFLVKCVVCENFVVLQQVDFETYGHDEALYCVCQTCLRSTPHNVLQDKLQDLYEVARPLQSY